MSNVEHLTDMSAFEKALNEPEDTCHWYPEDPRYRRSGSRIPQPGDIAWCGHVKETPHKSRAELQRLPKCAQCLRIRKLEGAVER